MTTVALQLDPPLPVYVPARRQAGLAHVMLDYGPEYDTIWCVIMADGEWWWLRMAEIRGQDNATFGRARTPEPKGDVPR